MYRLPLLHGVFGLEGAAAVLFEVLGTVILMLHITALVLLSEGAHDRRARWRWAVLLVFVPVVGPSLYLLRHRDRLHLPPRA